MGEIRTEDYLEQLTAIMEKNGQNPDNIQLVDGFPNDPFRVIKCFKIDGRIFIKKVISEEEKTSNIEALRQFEDKDRDALKDDWGFLKHKLLAEICHIQSRWLDDYACYKWAFYQMKKQ